MKRIFGLCNLLEYVLGNIICPDPMHDPVGAKNWDFNDSYVAMLICENISASQKVYVCRGCSPRHQALKVLS